jgi:hypothetical protein
VHAAVGARAPSAVHKEYVYVTREDLHGMYNEDSEAVELLVKIKEKQGKFVDGLGGVRRYRVLVQVMV